MQVLHDLGLPLCSWNNIPVIPGGDDLLPLEVAQVFLQLVAEFFITVGIGDEDLICHDILLCKPEHAEALIDREFFVDDAD